jgi:hypothetical protein
VFVLLDCDRYAPVRPDINARDRATAVDDALDGALNVSLREFAFDMILTPYRSRSSEPLTIKAVSFNLWKKRLTGMQRNCLSAGAADGESGWYAGFDTQIWTG